ncbi:MAG: hypothetical protein AMXMBFR53_35450 [Gemmatimonadota bacterium]
MVRPGRHLVRYPPFGRLRWAVLAAGFTFLPAGAPPPRADAADVPTLRGRVTLRIGDAFGAEEYAFGKVSGVVPVGGGRIAIADAQASEVRIFGPDGRYLYTATKSGQGPTEVAQPCCLKRGPDGALWIRDTGNARYLVVDLAPTGAATRGTVRMVHAFAGMWAAPAFRGDTLIDVGADFDPAYGPRVKRFFVTPDGRVARSETGAQPPATELGDVQLSTSRGLLYFAQPYGAKYLVAHGRDGIWAEAVTSMGRVTLHRPDGGSLTVETGIALGPALSRGERRAAEEALGRHRRRAGAQAGQLSMTLPARKPPLAALYFDESGRLWVQQSVGDGADEEALVYSTAGALVERRVWPSGISFADIGFPGGSSGFGVQRDALDVEQVVRVEWTRTGGPGGG